MATSRISNQLRIARGLHAKRGFTLVEMMITVALLGILAALAVPAFSDFIRNSRMQEPVQAMYRDLAFTRSEAVKRADDVVICSSNNADAANPTCSGRWSRGWIVYHEAGGTTEILKRYVLPDGPITVRGPGGGSRVITYNSRGAPAGGRTIRFCVADKDVTNRRIVVTNYGRARIELGDKKTADDDDGGVSC